MLSLSLCSVGEIIGQWPYSSLVSGCLLCCTAPGLMLFSIFFLTILHSLSPHSPSPRGITKRKEKRKKEEKKTDAYLCSMRCRCAYRGPTTATFLVFSLFLAVLPKKKYSHREFPSSFFSGQQSVFFCLFAVALSAPIALRRVKIIRNES